MSNDSSWIVTILKFLKSSKVKQEQLQKKQEERSKSKNGQSVTGSPSSSKKESTSVPHTPKLKKYSSLSDIRKNRSPSSNSTNTVVGSHGQNSPVAERRGIRHFSSTIFSSNSSKTSVPGTNNSNSFLNFDFEENREISSTKPASKSTDEAIHSPATLQPSTTFNSVNSIPTKNSSSSVGNNKADSKQSLTLDPSFMSDLSSSSSLFSFDKNQSGSSFLMGIQEDDNEHKINLGGDEEGKGNSRASHDRTTSKASQLSVSTNNTSFFNNTNNILLLDTSTNLLTMDNSKSDSIEPPKHQSSPKDLSPEFPELTTNLLNDVFGEGASSDIPAGIVSQIDADPILPDQPINDANNNNNNKDSTLQKSEPNDSIALDKEKESSLEQNIESKTTEPSNSSSSSPLKSPDLAGPQSKDSPSSNSLPTQNDDSPEIPASTPSSSKDETDKQPNHESTASNPSPVSKHDLPVNESLSSLVSNNSKESLPNEETTLVSEQATNSQDGVSSPFSKAEKPQSVELEQTATVDEEEEKEQDATNSTISSESLSTEEPSSKLTITKLEEESNDAENLIKSPTSVKSLDTNASESTDGTVATDDAAVTDKTNTTQDEQTKTGKKSTVDVQEESQEEIEPSEASSSTKIKDSDVDDSTCEKKAGKSETVAVLDNNELDTNTTLSKSTESPTKLHKDNVPSSPTQSTLEVNEEKENGASKNETTTPLFDEAELTKGHSKKENSDTEDADQDKSAKVELEKEAPVPREIEEDQSLVSTKEADKEKALSSTETIKEAEEEKPSSTITEEAVTKTSIFEDDDKKESLDVSDKNLTEQKSSPIITKEDDEKPESTVTKDVKVESEKNEKLESTIANDIKNEKPTASIAKNTKEEKPTSPIASDIEEDEEKSTSPITKHEEESSTHNGKDANSEERENPIEPKSLKLETEPVKDKLEKSIDIPEVKPIDKKSVISKDEVEKEKSPSSATAEVDDPSSTSPLAAEASSGEEDEASEDEDTSSSEEETSSDEEEEGEESDEDSDEDEDEDEETSSSEEEEEEEDTQPEVFLYTSFCSGTHYIPSDTNRMAHILSSYDIKFQYVDLATNERAKRIWKRRSHGRRLPGVVRNDEILADIKKLEEYNENHEVWQRIIEDEVY